MSFPPTPSFLMNSIPNSNGAQYNGKIIIASLSMLCFVVLFILALHIYAKWFWRRSTRRQLALRRRRHGPAFQGQEPITVGLDKAVVDSLPTFIYKVSEIFHEEAMECAVCLCEFEEKEKGRLLPKCNHSFHTDCIDMWFLSHTTCPLCRTSAEPVQVHREVPRPAAAAELELSVLEGAESILLPQPSNESVHLQQPINGNRDFHLSTEPTTAEDGAGQSLPSPGWRWRRSTSDRFSHNPHGGVQFPTNVLFWGDNSHVTSHASASQVLPPRLEHGQRGGRSLPHMVIDVPRGHMPNVMTTRCSSSGTQACPSPSCGHQQEASQQSCKSPGTHLNVFKRLLSRERKVFPTEQEMGSSCNVGGPSGGATASES